MKKQIPVPSRSSLSMVFLIMLLSAFFVSIVVVIHLFKGIPVGNLTRDFATVAGFPPYICFFSQLGILFWSASASACLLGATIVAKRPDSFKSRNFLFVSGFLTIVLGFDDLFLVHEYVFPKYFGISEKVVFSFYLVFLLFYLVKYFLLIVKTDYILLMMALAFFSLSMIMDLLAVPGLLDSYLLEDGSKMVGIISWLFYFFRTSRALCDVSSV